MADTLPITDNRTGKQYEIPIVDGAIRAIDLRRIKPDGSSACCAGGRASGTPRTRCSNGRSTSCFILHADHEQNCSTSAMRGIGSSQADPFAALAGAAAALYGPLHGGANEEDQRDYVEPARRSA